MLPEPVLSVLWIWPWLLRLRGVGLVLLGILDNSVVPLVGSMDVLTIWLAASDSRLWVYYAFMATAGAVLGGYFTYAIGREGGKEAIEHKFNKAKAQKLMQRFERMGFIWVSVGAIMPPPFPLVPVLLAAGAMQYPRKKFLGALTLGRSVRYLLVAGLGTLYGDAIVSFFSRYYMAALLTLIGLAVVGGIVTLVEYLRSRRHHQHAGEQHEKAA